MRRIGVALLVVLGAACSATIARGVEDAKVTLEVVPDATTVARGGAVGIEVVGTIAHGWHINAHQPTQPFLKPTVLTVGAEDGVAVDPINYPAPDKHTFAFAGNAELLVYQSKVGMTSAVPVPAEVAGEPGRVGATPPYHAGGGTTRRRPPP